MPKIPSRPKSFVGLTQFQLEQWGRRRMILFCRLNEIEIPAVRVVPREKWSVVPCAYYRPDTEANREWMNKLAGQGPGINICLEKCAKPCAEDQPRNWGWPGSTTDRTPYGVIAHELGHHCDWLSGEKKGSYFSEFSERMREESGEEPLTSYAPNAAEWFAEMFRLFVTNPRLLEAIRPATFGLLTDRWTPIEEKDWESPLGEGVPERILKACENKT